jgi:hypothetical protein
MITPIFHTYQVPTCPECGHEEDVKQVCKHCGYEYSESGYSKWTVIKWILIIILFLWVLCTAIIWIIGDIGYPQKPDPTLVQVIKNEYHWLVNLLHRIY